MKYLYIYKARTSNRCQNSRHKIHQDIKDAKMCQGGCRLTYSQRLQIEWSKKSSSKSSKFGRFTTSMACWNPDSLANVFHKKNGKSRGIKTCLCIMWYYVCIFQDDRIYQGLSKSFIFPAVSRLNESNPGANCVGSCWGHIPYGTNTPAYLHSTKLTL